MNIAWWHRFSVLTGAVYSSVLVRAVDEILGTHSVQTGCIAAPWPSLGCEMGTTKKERGSLIEGILCVA